MTFLDTDAQMVVSMWRARAEITVEAADKDWTSNPGATADEMIALFVENGREVAEELDPVSLYINMTTLSVMLAEERRKNAEGSAR